MQTGMMRLAGVIVLRLPGRHLGQLHLQRHQSQFCPPQPGRRQEVLLPGDRPGPTTGRL